MASAHAVYLNEDLLHLICDHLDYASVGALRLCSRYVERVASPHLFRTLLLSSRTAHLCRLHLVAANEKFAKGVREIVLETAWYSVYSRYHDEPLSVIFACLRTLSGKSRSSWENRLEELIRKGGSLNSYAKELSAHTPTSQELLRRTLKEFKGLRCLTVTPRYECRNSRGRLRDSDYELSQSTRMPPLSYQAYYNPYLWIRDATLCSIMRALSLAGHGLKEFHLEQSEENPDCQVFAGRTLAFENLKDSGADMLARSLRSLTKLHLHVSDHNPYGGVAKHELTRTLDRGRLARFLRPLTKLQELHLTAAGSCATRNYRRLNMSGIFGTAQLPLLRRLSLTALWMGGESLSDFLKRHDTTLEEVTLTEMSLGDTSTTTSQSNRPNKEPKHSLKDLSLCDHLRPDWVEVAQSCQLLHKLRSLKIEQPLTCRDNVGMSLSDAAELVLIGMHRR